MENILIYNNLNLDLLNYTVQTLHQIFSFLEYSIITNIEIILGVGSIFLASRAGRGLTNLSHAVGTAAGATYLYDYWKKANSGGSSNSDDKKDDDKKDENKKDDNKKDDDKKDENKK